VCTGTLPGSPARCDCVPPQDHILDTFHDCARQHHRPTGPSRDVSAPLLRGRNSCCADATPNVTLGHTSPPSSIPWTTPPGPRITVRRRRVERRQRCRGLRKLRPYRWMPPATLAALPGAPPDGGPPPLPANEQRSFGTSVDMHRNGLEAPGAPSFEARPPRVRERRSINVRVSASVDADEEVSPWHSDHCAPRPECTWRTWLS
jgi:hypothetical protein